MMVTVKAVKQRAIQSTPSRNIEIETTFTPEIFKFTDHAIILCRRRRRAITTTTNQ